MRNLIIVMICLALFVGACAAPAADPAANATAAPTEAAKEATSESTTAELTTVRVGYVPVTIFAALYIADGKGYFADEGIVLDLSSVDAGTENVVQVAAGNFDVAGGGVGAGMFNAIERGIEFEIVAPLHAERPPLASPFVISKKRFESGELTQMSDMAGKKVAINAKGAATEYWLWKALQQADLDFPDVEVLGVPFREIGAALENGALDGAILTEPLTTFAEDQELIVRLSEDFLTTFTPTYLYFNKEWATANPELGQKFVKAYIRGARDLNGEEPWQSDEIPAIIEQYTQVPAAVVKRARHAYHDPNGFVPLEDIMELQRFFRAQDELTYDDDIDMAPFINSSYAEQAVEELGGSVEWE